ncbi:MAG: CoA pyrophosphatase [Planktomarina sp.]|nr:CoA pyrophosphatase [Planktomarina sp.]
MTIISKSNIRRAIAQITKPTSDFDLNSSNYKSSGQTKEAGVLLPIIRQFDGIYLVLTKRAAHLSTHPGQISFPGGKRENKDTNIEATALREAQEEIGLKTEVVEVLGRLPAHETVTGFQITPIIGWIETNWTAVADPNEVTEVFQVPLSYITNIKNFQIQDRVWNGRKRYYYTVPYGPYYIWGATACILYNFAMELGET